MKRVQNLRSEKHQFVAMGVLSGGEALPVRVRGHCPPAAFYCCNLFNAGWCSLAGLHFAKPIWHSTLGGEWIQYAEWKPPLKGGHLLMLTVLHLQLAKLHQLSMQQSINPVAQPATTIIPGMAHNIAEQLYLCFSKLCSNDWSNHFNGNLILKDKQWDGILPSASGRLEADRTATLKQCNNKI